MIEQTSEKYPNDALILATAGMIYNATGDIALAYETFKQTEELDPAGTQNAQNIGGLSDSLSSESSATLTGALGFILPPRC
jgi:Flp pilus assembly protein TadD